MLTVPVIFIFLLEPLGLHIISNCISCRIQDAVSEKQDLAAWKSIGKRSFEKGEYVTAVHFYSLVNA
jgi:hypothetical protein